ncbi:MAG TPA: molybdopterin molybdotransferase MoeA [Tepidisphaeraceae bacterium]|jgi:molybdopterin molybdotransferase
MSEVGLDELITAAAAISVIDATPVSLCVEYVPLTDADGRVLAADVLADRDYPVFEKALMDGYAVRAADTTAGRLKAVGEVAAGGQHRAALGAGECVAIMTGAPLPPGADSVVPIERTRRDGDVVLLEGPIRCGASVAPRAADSAAGRLLLARGTRLGPAQLAVCAQVGVAAPAVFARPRVGILSSGDEIVPFDAEPTGTQLRNSNTPLLASLVRRYGGDVVDLGHVRDDPAAIAERLSTGGLDAILVTGGMSMGVYDYTPRVMRDLGYELAITKLKIKPGKPFVFARRAADHTSEPNSTNPAAGVNPRATDADSKIETVAARVHTRGSYPTSVKPVDAAPAPTPFIFGLPGNPVSAFVCTVRLASRLLLRLGGASPEPQWTTATLGHYLPPNGPREFYQPTVIEAGTARVLAWNGSADLFTLAQANALLPRRTDEPQLPSGTSVTLIRLP